MQTFERQYAELLRVVMMAPERGVRNGLARSTFGMHLTIEVGNTFPILQGRKMYPSGVFGELAAMLRGPKHIDDFKKFGCNYWDKFADADGNITLDYGNAWLDNHQMARLFECLANDKTDRRMLINGWRPERLPELSLPCCHYSYQFYVDHNNCLHMLWSQRSVDMMLGLPSDIVFAAAWLIALANQFNLIPGRIVMSLGDCHIYSEHYEGAEEYIQRVFESTDRTAVHYSYGCRPGSNSLDFDPMDIFLKDYNPMPAIKLELKV